MSAITLVEQRYWKEVHRVNTMSRLFASGARGPEISYIVVSLLFLAAGICAVWFVQSVLDVEGEAILVAFLVVPLALYLIVSGRVREITAGSLSVQLNEASRKPVGQALVPRSEYVIAELTELVSPFDPADPIAVKTDPNRPQVVTLTHGGGPYERDQVLQGLKNIAATNPVPFLIVVDHGRVLAYMTYRSALDLLEREDRGEEFITLVNAGEPHAFDDGGGFSALKTEWVMQKTTNVDALEMMEKTSLDALVVVKGNGQFEGIVERGRVLSTMMLALVSPPSRT